MCSTVSRVFFSSASEQATSKAARDRSEKSAGSKIDRNNVMATLLNEPRGVMFESPVVGPAPVRERVGRRPRNPRTVRRPCRSGPLLSKQREDRFPGADCERPALLVGHVCPVVDAQHVIDRRND